VNRFFLRSSGLAALAAATVLLPLTSYAEDFSGQTVLKSALSVDGMKHTVTLPLYRGTHNGATVWYIITDASDSSEAKRLNVVYSPNLANIGDGALQHVTKSADGYVFAGVPTFSNRRTYIPSKSGFPPTSAKPGSVGDANYSPFVRADGVPGVLNAPIVASGEGNFDVTSHTNTEDRVVAIDAKAKTVTLVLARGFVDGKPVNYLSTDASDPVAATVERATYAPKLKLANAAAVIPIGVVIEGPRSPGNGQGLAFLALDTPLEKPVTPSNAASIGSPFNVLSLAPNPANLYAPNGYSPLWDVRVLPKGRATQIKDFATFAASGPKPAGFVVNCPVIAFE